MKSVVEWGRPKKATRRKLCGVSGSMVMPSATQAMLLANQIFFSMTEEEGYRVESWAVTAARPRAVVWNKDRTFWVAVSVLDGVPRGAYAGIAERESLMD